MLLSMKQSAEYEKLKDLVFIHEKIKFDQLVDYINKNPEEDSLSTYCRSFNTTLGDAYNEGPKKTGEIFRKFILADDADKNLELLSLAMRLLFKSLLYFDDYSNQLWAELMKVLMNLSKILEEPHSTYAIKCLQIGFHRISRRTYKPIEGLKEFVEFLIHRLILLSKIEETSGPVSVHFSAKCENIFINPQKSSDSYINKDLHELCAVDYDIFEIYKTPISSIFSQRFHGLVLLKFILPLIMSSEITTSDALFMLLFSSININDCKFELINCCAISIINDLIISEKFNHVFMDFDGISRICSVPFSLSSCLYVCTTLKKISNIYKAMQMICKFNPEFVKITINYIMSSMRTHSIDDQWIFLSNSFKFNRFFAYFTSSNAILDIFEILTKNPKYNINNNDKGISIYPKLFTRHKSIILESIDTLSLYTIRSILSIYPSDTGRLKILSSSDSIFYDSLDYFNLIESIGGLKGPIDFLDEMLTNDFIEWVFNIFLNYERSDVMSFAWKKIHLFYYIFSLYNKFKETFIIPFDPDIIIGCLKNQISRSACSQSSISIYNIKMCLMILLSCFESNEQYLNFLNNDAITVYWDSNKDFIKFCKIFTKLDLIYYFMIISTNELKKNEVDVKHFLHVRACCIKILYLLSFEEKACQIMSEFPTYFNMDLPKILVDSLKGHRDAPELEICYEFYFRLIVRINKINKKCLRFPISLEFQNGFNRSAPNELQKFFKIMAEKMFRNDNKYYSNSEIYTNHIFLKHFKGLYINSTILKTAKYLKYFYETNGNYPSWLLDNNIFQNSNIKHCEINANYYPQRTFKFSRLGKKMNLHREMYKIYELIRTVDYWEPIQREDHCVKFTNDGNVAFTFNRSKFFRLFLPNFKDFAVYCSPARIQFLKQSNNGKFIVTSGNTESNQYISSIFKYYPFSTEKRIEPINYLSDSVYATFSRSDTKLYSVSSDRSLQIFDAEKGIRTEKFSNINKQSFYYFNSIDNNKDDSLVHFNGDIYCTRSAKLVNRFQRFNHLMSGKFMPSYTELLIHCQLWDIRTFKLFGTIDDLNYTAVNRTDNDGILYGIKFTNYWQSIYSEIDYFKNWLECFKPCPARLSFYCSNNFSKLTEIDMSSDESIYLDVSQDATKFITLFPSCFKVYEFGLRTKTI